MAVEHRGHKFARIGHSSVRIGTEDDQVIYIDPWSNVLDNTPSDADIVLVSHDDPDHYDVEAIEAVASDETTVAVYEGVDTSDLGYSVIEIPYEGEKSIDNFEVRTVPAHNRAEGEHIDESGDPFHDVGEVVGFILTIDGTTVYYTSDTDFLPIHEDLHADVLILPIGGHYTMDRHEAADFAESVAPELVLPVHYNTFEAIETDATAFIEDVEARSDMQVELF